MFAENNKTKYTHSSSAGRNALLMERSEEKGQTGHSWQEGNSHANNYILQQWYAEGHLWTYNTLNLLRG